MTPDRLTPRDMATVAFAFAMSLAGVGLAYWQLVNELTRIGGLQ